VNIGAIAAKAEQGAFESGEPAGGSKAKTAAPVTINQEILRAVGLVRTIKKPLKILGTGELSTALFVVADAFTKSAVSKIEAAGGTVSVLEVPATVLPALGVGEDGERAPRTRRTAEGRAAAGRDVAARANRDARAAEDLAEKAAAAAKPKKSPAPKAEAAPAEPDAADAVDATAAESVAAEAPQEAPAAADAPAADDENS
jgi:hypothetical protein